MSATLVTKKKKKTVQISAIHSTEAVCLHFELFLRVHTHNTRSTYAARQTLLQRCMVTKCGRQQQLERAQTTASGEPYRSVSSEFQLLIERNIARHSHFKMIKGRIR